jgi:hypothetical protein
MGLLKDAFGIGKQDNAQFNQKSTPDGNRTVRVSYNDADKGSGKHETTFSKTDYGSGSHVEGWHGKDYPLGSGKK